MYVLASFLTPYRGACVKHQYVGDINDYRKYALLRALSAGGANRIGVCWMLTPDDGGTDGNRRSYAKYQHCDPELFDVLTPTLDDPSLRRVSYIEESGIIPGATFHANPLPPVAAERAAYMAECQTRFADTDLVFFDPDNGIASPATKPGQTTTLHVSLEEAAAFYGGGKSVLLYQHRPKLQTWEALIASKAEQLRAAIPNAVMWVFWRADVAFFLLVHPESPARLAVAAMEICGSWETGFIRGEYLGQSNCKAATLSFAEAQY